LISHCTIENNDANEDGGGIFCENSSPTIEYCLIKNNDANHKGGGIQLENNANPIIRYCTIIENIADFGAGVCCYGTDPEIVNCTIYNNEALYGGGICCLSSAAPVIKNTILAGTASGYGIYSMSSPDVSISFCDFYDNLNGHTLGNTPSGFGTLVDVNANGDSCDTYQNIFLDPMLVDPAGYDFNLLEDSPCIDAGDPTSPLDPDNTIADIGAFYYHQEIPSPIIVELTYVSGSPVPATGGNLVFDVYVENIGQDPVDFDAWLAVQYAGGQPTTLVMRSFTNYLPGWAINRPGTFYPIPGSWPAGGYMFWGRVGEEPETVWDESGFPFVKAGSDYIGGFVPSPVAGAPNPFDVLERNLAGITSAGYGILDAYPNPFNSTTSLTYFLQDAGEVNLDVHDISGSLVATVVNGYRTVGIHEVTFHASNLPTGVYFAQLKAGHLKQTQKLLLIK
jgi:parallel beta-helix repeat protein